MDKDDDTATVNNHRSTYISAGCMMSPSCFHHDEFEYSRIHYSQRRKKGWRWRRILRRLMRESKTSLCCRSNKPISFQYDPVSYSQNFDDGCHLQEPARLSHVFQDVRLESQCKI